VQHATTVDDRVGGYDREVNFGIGGGIGVQATPLALAAIAALVGLGLVVVAETHEPKRRPACCGTGHVPQIIPADLCRATFPAACCPVVT
jgi:hypothetical protein